MVTTHHQPYEYVDPRLRAEQRAAEGRLSETWHVPRDMRVHQGSDDTTERRLSCARDHSHFRLTW